MLFEKFLSPPSFLINYSAPCLALSFIININQPEISLDIIWAVSNNDFKRYPRLS